MLKPVLSDGEFIWPRDWRHPDRWLLTIGDEVVERRLYRWRIFAWLRSQLVSLPSKITVFDGIAEDELRLRASGEWDRLPPEHKAKRRYWRDLAVTPTAD